MANIQEITELLINEITSFNKAVDELKKQTTIIQDIEIAPETEELNVLLNTHITSFKEIQASFLHLQEDNKTSSKQNISKFQLLVILILFLISTGSIAYSNYNLQQVNKKEKKAYTKGIEDFSNHIKEFFEEYPKSYKAYQKWKNK